MAFHNIGPFIVMRYNGAAPYLWSRDRAIISVNIVVFFDCSAAAALSFCPMRRYTGIVELIVADNEPRAFITIDRPFNARRIVKYIIFYENELFRPPIGVICPRAVTVIASVPRGVVNLHRLHPGKIELAMINHAPQEAIDTYIHRVQAIERAVVNAECVRLSRKLNSRSPWGRVFHVVAGSFEGESC